LKPKPPQFAVSTAVDVAADPGTVWEHVVSFSQLAPPSELLFRLGIAYPVRAEIVGRGAGAVRHCVFSTGAFVEPIEVWNPPRLLRFSVTVNPAPMQEWSPFEIQPPHLGGYLVSVAGQFRITPLAGSRCRLEGPPGIAITCGQPPTGGCGPTPSFTGSTGACFAISSSWPRAERPSPTRASDSQSRRRWGRQTLLPPQLTRVFEVITMIT